MDCKSCKDSSDASEIELISMDLNGENRRVAAVIPAGDHSLNTWWLEDILPAYFAGGKALFLGTYFKTVPGVSDDETVNIQGEQLLMDFETGKATEIWSGDMYDFDRVMMGPAFNFSYKGDIYYSPAESYYGTEDEPLEIRRINGKTGEEEVVPPPLPETVDEYTIWGITDDYVIVSDQDNQNISWLTKEDFEKGNYKAKKEIQFVW